SFRAGISTVTSESGGLAGTASSRSRTRCGCHGTSSTPSHAASAANASTVSIIAGLKRPGRRRPADAPRSVPEDQEIPPRLLVVGRRRLVAVRPVLARRGAGIRQIGRIHDVHPGVAALEIQRILREVL